MKRTTLILAAILGFSSMAYGDGKELYEKKCASCHAKDGEAKTKMGEKLKVRPFTDKDVQAGLTPEKLTAVIKDGIPDKKMPAEKKLTDDEVKAVVDYTIATFKK